MRGIPDGYLGVLPGHLLIYGVHAIESSPRNFPITYVTRRNLVPVFISVAALSSAKSGFGTDLTTKNKANTNRGENLNAFWKCAWSLCGRNVRT